MGGVVCLLVVVLVCGFGAGMVSVYLLRRRKERKRSEQTIKTSFVFQNSFITSNTFRADSEFCWQVHGPKPHLRRQCRHL